MYSIDPMIKLYFLHFYNLSYVFVKSRCLLHVSNFLHPWNISTETLEASPMSQVTGINSFAENPSKGLKIVLSQIECRLSSPNSKACKCMHIYIYSNMNMLTPNHRDQSQQSDAKSPNFRRKLKVSYIFWRIINKSHRICEKEGARI